MSNQQDFREAFPADDDYDLGPDYVAVILAVILALIVVVISLSLCIPLQ